MVGHRRTATASLLPLQLGRLRRRDGVVVGFGGGCTAGLARRRLASRQAGHGGSVLGGVDIFGHLASSSLVRTSSASSDARRRRLRRVRLRRRRLHLRLRRSKRWRLAARTSTTATASAAAAGGDSFSLVDLARSKWLGDLLDDAKVCENFGWFFD